MYLLRTWYITLLYKYHSAIYFNTPLASSKGGVLMLVIGWTYLLLFHKTRLMFPSFI